MRSLIEGSFVIYEIYRHSQKTASPKQGDPVFLAFSLLMFKDTIEPRVVELRTV